MQYDMTLTPDDFYDGEMGRRYCERRSEALDMEAESKMYEIDDAHAEAIEMNRQRDIAAAEAAREAVIERAYELGFDDPNIAHTREYEHAKRFLELYEAELTGD